MDQDKKTPLWQLRFDVWQLTVEMEKVMICEERQLGVELVCWAGEGGRGGGSRAVSQESSHDCPQLEMAGWLAHYSRPGLLPPASRPTTTSAAAAAPMPPLAAPPPWCTTAALLRQPAAPAVWCSTNPPSCHAATSKPSICGSEGGVAAPNSTPGWQGDFLQTCEFGRAAILRPMAARPCSLAPALGNVLVMPNWGRYTQRRGAEAGPA